jgi:hypothetical protein
MRWRDGSERVVWSAGRVIWVVVLVAAVDEMWE